MQTVRVLLAAASPLVRHGMARALDGSSVEIVAEAAEIGEVIALAGQERPNIILLHLDGSAVDGQDTLRLLVAEAPATKLIVVAEIEDDEGVVAAIEAGARGYGVQRHVWPEDLRSAISAVARGYLWLCPASTQQLLARLSDKEEGQAVGRDGPAAPLTEREFTVLRMIGEGLTYGEIAASLYLSKNTVKTYVRRLLEKLEVGTRQQALVKAISAGILPDRRALAEASEREQKATATAGT